MCRSGNEEGTGLSAPLCVLLRTHRSPSRLPSLAHNLLPFAPECPDTVRPTRPTAAAFTGSPFIAANAPHAPLPGCLQSPQGYDRTGPYRASFLLEAVADLRARLRRAGSELVVRLGRPEEVLPALAKRLGAAAVFCHSEVTFEGRQVGIGLG